MSLMPGGRKLLVIANLACLALVALVPLTWLLGLAEIVVPLAAVAGFAMVAIPAALSALALLGLSRPGTWLARPLLLQLALFCALVMAVVSAVALYQMLADGRYDLAPFALGVLLLFAADLAILLPGVARRGPPSDGAS